ncbi:hypothetical protein EDB80DRAFT_395873 [Ilyonectria destructans]|nr:hypothetical protein EDB80DRAFT_395873 [Ilyonectria destructans]
MEQTSETRRLRRVPWTLWTWAWVCVWGGNVGTRERGKRHVWTGPGTEDGRWTLDNGTPSYRTDRERETENKGRRSAQ